MTDFTEVDRLRIRVAELEAILENLRKEYDELNDKYDKAIEAYSAASYRLESYRNL